jgi:hypothetical protein
MLVASILKPKIKLNRMQKNIDSISPTSYYNKAIGSNKNIEIP